MRASDLRVGNWIADRGGKEWQIDHWESANKVSAKIPTMVFDGVEMQGHPLTEDVEYLQPIPLTEGWLLKFGFGKQNGYPYKFNFGFIKMRNGIWFYKYYSLEIDLNYVHQLQNLYYALTGEELTYGK
jgi:hypothetical protein